MGRGTRRRAVGTVEFGTGTRSGRAGILADDKLRDAPGGQHADDASSRRITGACERRADICSTSRNARPRPSGHAAVQPGANPTTGSNADAAKRSDRHAVRSRCVWEWSYGSKYGPAKLHGSKLRGAERRSGKRRGAELQHAYDGPTSDRATDVSTGDGSLHGPADTAR